MLCPVAVRPGPREAFTVFLLPISELFGWDRADVVSIYSLAACRSGCGSPLVGRLFDRSGPRTVYALGLLLIGGAFSLAALAQALWQFQACLGLAVGLGTACLGNVTNSLLLGRWFGRRLPTAMAIVFSAAGAGIVTLLPLSQLLIERTGWRGAYHLLGGAALALRSRCCCCRGAGSPPARRMAPRKADDLRSARLDAASAHPASRVLGDLLGLFLHRGGMFAISVQVVAYLVEAGFPRCRQRPPGALAASCRVRHARHLQLDGLIGRRPSVLFSYGVSTVGIVMLWLINITRTPGCWPVSSSASAA